MGITALFKGESGTDTEEISPLDKVAVVVEAVAAQEEAKRRYDALNARAKTFPQEDASPRAGLARQAAQDAHEAWGASVTNTIAVRERERIVSARQAGWTRHLAYLNAKLEAAREAAMALQAVAVPQDDVNPDGTVL
jgi:hypothetical protein